MELTHHFFHFSHCKSVIVILLLMNLLLSSFLSIWTFLSAKSPIWIVENPHAICHFQHCITIVSIPSKLRDIKWQKNELSRQSSSWSSTRRSDRRVFCIASALKSEPSEVPTSWRQWRDKIAVCQIAYRLSACEGRDGKESISFGEQPTSQAGRAREAFELWFCDFRGRVVEIKQLASEVPAWLLGYMLMCIFSERGADLWEHVESSMCHGNASSEANW